MTEVLPSSTGLMTRDSGFQEIDVKLINDTIDQKTLIDKKMIDNDNLDPWNNSKDKEDYESIKFNSKKDDSIDDDTELIFDPLGDEKAIISDSSLSEEEKKEKITRIFTRASSNGNLEKVTSMLENSREYIDIDAQDEEGTTPLIYAACFAHESVAYTLLEAGAKVDAKDSNGWTPLIWAANSSHDAIVKLLLDHGADATAKTANRRTVFDFMTPEQNPKIVEIFNHNPQRDSWSSSGSVGRWSWYDPSDHKLEEQMAEAEMKKRMLMESAYNLEVDMASLGLDEPETQDEEEEPLSEFMWNICLPDQMFVFSHEDIPHILKTVILGMQPIRSKIQKPVPANIIFLSARFAHYYSSSELLESFLFSVVDAIDQSIKARPEDMTLLSFWISNCTLLLYYLKKDPGLAIATIEYQLRISEQLHEIYVLLVKDAQRRIDKILEVSMLEFDTIPGLDDVRFEGEWRVFKHFSRRSRSPVNSYSPVLNLQQSSSTSLKRSSSTSSILGPIFRSPPSPRQRSAPSPRNVTSLLSSTLFVLQTYEIHPMIIEQVMNQLFYFMSCELFNKILSKKKFLCRSKAMQIRLNVSAIEDWVRTNNLSLTLINHFQPLIQLLQLLMCWSQMTDFSILVQTTKELNLINPAQLKRVSKNYRYEVNETRITEECQQYILQLEEDTERRKKRYSTESIRSDRSDASSIIYLTVSPTLPPCGTGPGWEDDDDLMEMKDSEMLLPFAIPTSTEMLANYGGQEKEDEFIPLVPDEWMERLDVGMRRGPSSVVEELTSQWEAEYDENEDDDYDIDSNLQIGGITSSI
uniref:Dilute domain-containing protein C25B8.08 n=1 Tax=Anthurium amnicola TaxID=1678845 RepID=A0A1D1Y834_9ARAE